MCGSKLGLKFVAISGLQISLEIVRRDQRQEGIAEVWGIAFVIDQEVRPLSRKRAAECIKGAASSGTV